MALNAITITYRWRHQCLDCNIPQRSQDDIIRIDNLVLGRITPVTAVCSGCDIKGAANSWIQDQRRRFKDSRPRQGIELHDRNMNYLKTYRFCFSVGRGKCHRAQPLAGEKAGKMGLKISVIFCHIHAAGAANKSSGFGIRTEIDT
ncbi:hypothetical protein EVAR_94612_1 [Eumeta japonica]|uniref:Uncharacterized protein n=1 Tax=Eumeta variegata TaxID=151549 RepID=A0A4C1UUV8_EUMVA|nr:hypothetical protein EVAR_94612_1 [Eumeta japonica]